MTAQATTAWRVQLLTAGSTEVQFACSRRTDGDPWLLSPVLNQLLHLGAERIDRPHAAGAGRGQPIIHAQRLQLHDCELELRAMHHRDGPDMVSLSLPPGDELPMMVDEDCFWELCDVVAAESDARYGCIGDGESLNPVEPADVAGVRSMLRRHIGLLLRDVEVAPLRNDAGLYAVLPRSGLSVLLR